MYVVKTLYKMDQSRVVSSSQSLRDGWSSCMCVRARRQCCSISTTWRRSASLCRRWVTTRCFSTTIETRCRSICHVVSLSLCPPMTLSSSTSPRYRPHQQQRGRHRHWWRHSYWSLVSGPKGPWSEVGNCPVQCAKPMYRFCTLNSTIAYFVYECIRPVK